MSRSVVSCPALDVLYKLFLEFIVSDVSLLFLLLLFPLLILLLLNLINNIQSSAFVSQQVSAPQVVHAAVLLSQLEEAVTDVRNHVSLLHLLQFLLNILIECQSLVFLSHFILNLHDVVLLSVFLMLLYHADGRVAVVGAHVLNELSTVTYQHALQSVNEWARSLIESIRAAN